MLVVTLVQKESIYVSNEWLRSGQPERESQFLFLDRYFQHTQVNSLCMVEHSTPWYILWDIDPHIPSLWCDLFNHSSQTPASSLSASLFSSQADPMSAPWGETIWHREQSVKFLACSQQPLPLQLQMFTSHDTVSQQIKYTPRWISSVTLCQFSLDFKLWLSCCFTCRMMLSSHLLSYLLKNPLKWTEHPVNLHYGNPDDEFMQIQLISGVLNLVLFFPRSLKVNFSYQIS